MAEFNGETYWTCFAFDGYTPDELHCTHKFLGELNDDQINGIQLLLELGFMEGSSLKPSQSIQVTFDTEDFFGESKDVRVLKPSKDVRSLMLPDLKKVLDEYREDDHEWSPHVTTNMPIVDMPLTRYCLCRGDEILLDIRLDGKEENPKILDVPNVQQQWDWDCGPAATMSVCAYFGENDLATEEEYITALGTDVNNGTPVSSVCNYLNTVGLNYEDKNNLTIQDLQRSIAMGSPVMTLIQDYEELPSDIVNQRAGHWVIVIGADDENVYLQDPSAYDTDGRVVMSALDFLSRWQDYDGTIPDSDTQYTHFGIAVHGPMTGDVIMGKDMIPGGLADDASTSDFDSDQLAIGIRIEMEHTNDEAIATEIAMDHLTEDPMYYSKLQGMEKDAGDEGDYHYNAGIEAFRQGRPLSDSNDYSGDDKTMFEYGWNDAKNNPDIQSGWKSTDKATIGMASDGSGRFVVLNSRGEVVAGPFDDEREAESVSSMISMGFPYQRSFDVDINEVALQFCALSSIGQKASPEVMGMLQKATYGTMIHQDENDPEKGTDENGRPVTFSREMWAWVYDDTPGEEAVEKVDNPQLMRSNDVVA